MPTGRKLRMTRQRQVILEELRKVASHPTADQVYSMVRRRLPRVSLGTVYRNLEVLSGSGVIRKLEIGGAPRRFDGNATDHHHVRCLRCDRLEDIGVKPATAVEDAVRAASDYDIFGYRLEFFGLCPRCRDEARGNDN